MSVHVAPGWTATGIQVQPLAMTGPPQRLRLLMLHSFRTSAAIFNQQMRISGLDAQLKDVVELIYIDAPHEASGPIPADVQPYFDPPYREWWNFVRKDGDGAMQYIGFSESVAYIESKLRDHAPVHGLCAFSQGAALAALLASYQRQGELLQSVDTLKCCLLFAGVMSRLEEHRPAYTQPIACPSLHVIGDRDPIGRIAERLAACFQDPEVIRHPRGHVIPSLPADDVKRMRDFLELVRVSVAQPSL